MEVSGQVGIFEGAKACAPLRRILLGWRAQAQWIFAPALLVACFLGYWIADTLVPRSGSLGMIPVIFIGFVIWVRLAGRMVPNAWMRRGVPASSQVTYRLDEDALVILCPVSETRLAWAGLTEIAPGVGAWLIIGQGAAYFIPRQLFASVEAERTFLAALLDRLPPEARARSEKAAGFAA